MLNTISGLLSGGVAPTDYESIATTTVGVGGASTVTFTSIPSTYSHLQIRIMGRGTFANSLDNTLVQFNSDTASNYSQHQLAGSGSAASAEGAASQTSMYAGLYPAALAGANIFGVAIIDILDYANTNKYKTIRTLSGNDQNGSGYVVLRSGSWRNTAAITSIQLPIGAGLYGQYSSFALYGIKA